MFHSLSVFASHPLPVEVQWILLNRMGTFLSIHEKEYLPLVQEAYQQRQERKGGKIKLEGPGLNHVKAWNNREVDKGAK